MIALARAVHIRLYIYPPVRERNLTMIRMTLPLLTACVLLACSSPNPDAGKTEALKRAVQQAHKLFEMTQADSMANASFYSLHQMGGTGIHYLVASLPDRDVIECYEEGKPKGPWCVVVRNGPGDMDITIEGYGAQTDSPVVSRVARLGEPKRF
jgi:hypothetical protein